MPVKSALLIVYNVNALLFIKLMKGFVYTFLSLRSVIIRTASWNQRCG